ncbi:MAG: hypothetical protein EBY86_07320, partial [Acidimicrobiia bacterium]|nr:hypothetical protein [Acidimicrobiia bacterium]
MRFHRVRSTEHAPQHLACERHRDTRGVVRDFFGKALCGGQQVAWFVQRPNEAAAQRQSLLEYPSIHSPKVGLQGMVVSQNEIASAVGARILAEGGNAFDAAVAVGFALAVTLPRAGNIGGDGFLTAYVASQRKVTTIDFRSVAPQTAQLEMFLDAKGEESESASVGYRAAA